MSISSISGTNQTDSSQALAALLQASQNNGSASSVADSESTGAATSTQISGPAQMLAKLQALQTKDPDKFKQVMSDMADKLSTLANKTGDQKLSQLADKFKTAGETGDLSALQPPPPPSSAQAGAAAAYAQNDASGSKTGGHHYHHHASGSDSSNGQNAMSTLMTQFNQEISSALQ